MLTSDFVSGSRAASRLTLRGASRLLPRRRNVTT